MKLSHIILTGVVFALLFAGCDSSGTGGGGGYEIGDTGPSGVGFRKTWRKARSSSICSAACLSITRGQIPSLKRDHPVEMSDGFSIHSFIGKTGFRRII